jgi:hypothetical protein
MEEFGGVPSLSVTIGGQEASREGAMEERAQHLGVDEGDMAKKGNGRRPVPFMAARWLGREGRGMRGPGVGVAWREGSGEERGAWRGTARVAGIGPRLTGVSIGVVARQGRAPGHGRL